MAPYFLLELKIYGQWLSGGKRRLCKVAIPSSHLSVVGNFVGAILASKVGWKEPAKFLWAVGFARYLVVFVTLYQRSPTREALPKELHPVYSMFIAAPSAASLAWENIYGEFDGLSRNCYFIALFLCFTCRTDQFLHWFQVFSGMVVLHLSHDNCIGGNDQICRARTFNHKQGPCYWSFIYVISNGVCFVCVHFSPCFRLAHIVPK